MKSRLKFTPDTNSADYEYPGDMTDRDVLTIVSIRLRLVIGIILLVSLGFISRLPAQVYNVGDTVNNFSLPICSNGDGTWQLYNYYWKENGGQSHVIFLDIFATWCNPCQEAAPKTEEIYQKFKDRGLVVVGSGFDWGFPFSCEGWSNTFGLEYPILDDGEEEGPWRLFGKDTPTTVIIDHNMEVIYHEAGHNDAALRTVIDSALTAMNRNTGTGAENSLPEQVVLRPAHPNPFNSGTTLSFALTKPLHVSLDVYSHGGKLIKTLIAGEQSSGSYTVRWYGKNTNGVPVASGIYFVVLRSGQTSLIRKVTLLK